MNLKLIRHISGIQDKPSGRTGKDVAMSAESPLDALLAASHLMVPDDLSSLVHTYARKLGARAAVLYLVDLDQHWLVPLTPPDAPDLEELAIDGTIGGRCFRTVTLIENRTNGDTSIWVPVLDGTERLGVLHFTFGDTVADHEEVKAFTGLVAELMMTKGKYGDFFELARRRRPITVSSELLWQLLPPLTFGTDELVISAVFTPTARLGGDAFDYGVDQKTAQVGIFDAVGHDLSAGLLATAAVAAFRNARRSRLELRATAAHIGAAITEHFDPSKFVTGIIAHLDLGSGELAWTVAGHPPPLLLRHGRVVKPLDGGPGAPFAVGPSSDVVTEQLEPGDRVLLYTDGVTEARSSDGQPFELATLVDLVSRTSPSDPPPETMRLLMHAIETHNDGPLRDDATIVLIEWRGDGSRQLQV